MATTASPVQFPQEVKLEFKFLVNTPEDLEYLTSPVFAESIASDALRVFEDELDLHCIEVNGVKTTS